jgi:hypothetical protein
MNTLNMLIEQHILEAEARSRHVDEMIASQRSANGLVAAHVDAHLQLVQARRGRSTLELEGFRDVPHADRVKAGGRFDGVSGALQVVGAELEKALAAVLVSGHK